MRARPFTALISRLHLLSLFFRQSLMMRDMRVSVTLCYYGVTVLTISNKTIEHWIHYLEVLGSTLMNKVYIDVGMPERLVNKCKCTCSRLAQLKPIFPFFVLPFYVTVEV